MAVGTKDLASDELRGLDDDRLVDELRKAKEELFNLRFQSATGQLDNHGRLRAVRKDIARIYTEMRERELGIGRLEGGERPSERDDEGRERDRRPRLRTRNDRKTRQGYVVSDKMDKTVVVEVEDRVKHALYGKVLRRTSKVKAHDEANTAGVGDRVLIMETRPLSRHQALARGGDPREGQVSLAGGHAPRIPRQFGQALQPSARAENQHDV